MRSKRPFLRTVISVFVALTFLYSVMPGTMAMPAVKAGMNMDATSVMAMADSGAAPMHQHHKAPDPCKNMMVCGGLLACYGVAAVTADQPVLPRLAVYSPAPDISVTIAGLTTPPEDRPPIA